MEHTKKTISTAFCIELCIGLAKAAAAVHTRSVTLFAEAARSLVGAARHLPSARCADGGESAAKAMFVGAMLLSGCGAIVLVMGFVRVLRPVPLHSPGIALAVLGFSLALEAISLLGVLRRLREPSRALRLRRALASIAPERLAAIAGTVASALCVAASAVTGNLLWDAMGALIAGAIMMAMAVALGAEIRALAAGATLRDAEQQMEQPE